MVKAKFEISEDKKTLVLSIKGHAGAGEKGHDLVCAAASILANTVAQIVYIMHDKGQLRRKPTVKLNGGDATITCKPRDEAFHEALHTYSVAQVGFALLAKAHPDHVELHPFGKA